MSDCSIGHKEQNINSKSFRLRKMPHKSQQTYVQHYKLGELIGAGAYGNVYKALQLHTKQQVAAKVIDIQKLLEKKLLQLKKQIQIHSKLNHPNIVKIYETLWTSSKVYIFMELVDGKQLFRYLCQNDNLSQSQVANIFYQLLQAVKYIHQRNIVHRDIKAQNIVISSKLTPKLVDFGFSAIIKSKNDDFLSTFCGSPCYLAPQFFNKGKYSGQKVDIWCLGVLLYVMLEIRFPFQVELNENQLSRITNIEYHKPRKSSKEAQQIYDHVFKFQSQRVSLNYLLNSNFLKNYGVGKNNQAYSLTKRMVIKQPIIKKLSHLLRISSQQCMFKIENSILGEEYCVYRLLQNRFELQNKRRVRKTLKSTQDSECQQKTLTRSYDQTLKRRASKSENKKQDISLPFLSAPKVNRIKKNNSPFKDSQVEKGNKVPQKKQTIEVPDITRGNSPSS